ncbi:MAG TPA: ABC transporter permease [Candidatus Acidoferrales bacterium]|nr:ABC transporter permease [Candidatus Acidoferrales bacterium]
MIGVAKSLTRMSGLIAKELRDLVRRPGAILSLILGPLALMAVFGLGYDGTRKAYDTIVVLPTASQLSRDPKTYNDLRVPGVTVVQVTEDRAAAEARLGSREVRMVIVVPADAQARFMAGQQATVTCEWNEVDPIEDNIARVSTQMLLMELNTRVIQTAAAEGMRIANVQQPIPPDVVASPLKYDIKNEAPITPTMVGFFAPAVLALVLQHLGVTLTALSLVRERLSGAMDLFRVAPVRAWEVLIGKYVAYGFLSLAVAFVVTLLMTRLLAIPLLGSPERLATAVGFLTFASLGLGLLISLVADSERQAVQLAMIVLLVTVFFSGFVLPVDEFRPIVRPLSNVLPATYGIAIFDDVMLRGTLGDPLTFAGLLLLGVGLYIIDAFGLRLVMRRAR